MRITAGVETVIQIKRTNTIISHTKSYNSKRNLVGVVSNIYTPIRYMVEKQIKNIYMMNIKEKLPPVIVYDANC